MFFLTRPPSTAIYTLSLHDALPIYDRADSEPGDARRQLSHRELQDIDRATWGDPTPLGTVDILERAEEHTSELQSPDHIASRPSRAKKTRSTPTEACSSTSISRRAK